MAPTGSSYPQARSQWGRLKPIPIDPLEDLGLPSKGDSRLLDFKTQEGYFDRINERYHRYRKSEESDDGLRGTFASLSLASNEKTPMDEATAQENVGATSDQRESKELSVLIQAMRKLREGIVASHRVDGFAAQVYMFIIRTTILHKHMPSYHPALLHLLRRLHPTVSMSTSERDEFIGYYILDLACRQHGLAAAYQARHHYGYRNSAVESVLKALVHQDWLMFWKLKASMSLHQRCLMESADERLRSMAIKALGKAYLKVQVAYFEYATDCSWEGISEQDRLGWVLDGQTMKPRRTQHR